ncbi:MAG: hypothetical protein ABFD46_00570 [Armatimonadota bacterium]
MITIMLSIVGFLTILTLVSVYSALVLAHRTDNLINHMQEDNSGANWEAFGRI